MTVSPTDEQVEAADWLAGLTHKDWLRDGIRCSQEQWDFLDWSKAYMDMGPSVAGNLGPYWHVPDRDGDCTHRMYPRVLMGKWLNVIRRACVEANNKAALTAALARPAEGDEALRTALKPFAEAAECAESDEGDDYGLEGSSARYELTMGDLRRARVALSTSRPAQAEDGWKPIETADEDAEGIFWLTWAPDCRKFNEGTPIMNPISLGKRGRWSSVYTATHWMPLPEPPRDAKVNPIKFAGEESR